jgi:glycosyltransferase involved in cell wall biosynthesis
VSRPRLLHVTTVDMSLALLLGPQLRASAEAGFEVLGASAPGPYVDELEAAGITHIPLRHATRAMNPIRDLRLTAELRALFKRLRPDIVHLHNPKPNWFGRVAARTAGMPAIVNTVHGLYATPDDPWPRRAVVYALEWATGKCSHVELVQNAEDIPVLTRLRVDPAKLHLLGNGVDLVRFDRTSVPAHIRDRLRTEWGIAPGEVVCGAVGRLVREKGYAELFEAARQLRRAVPHLRFVVAGPADPDKSDAMSQAELDRATANGFRFLGMQADIEEFYAAIDLYVLASHREGFPRSAMEAAAMGLPIVATDIRGCRQVVDHGENGLLVPAGDAVRLAEAIGTVATDHVGRRAMGAAARTKSEADFDQQRQIDLTLAVYRELLER